MLHPNLFSKIYLLPQSCVSLSEHHEVFSEDIRPHDSNSHSPLGSSQLQSDAPLLLPPLFRLPFIHGPSFEHLPLHLNFRVKIQRLFL